MSPKPTCEELEQRVKGLEDEAVKRKQAEEALRESEQKYRTLVETNPYGIQEIDAIGIITYTNSTYQKMLGYTKEELSGESILNLLEQTSKRDELREHLSILVKEQPQPTTYFQKNRTKDGRVIDIEVAWKYNRDNEGRVVGFISVITDVTERKQMEEALQKTYNTLEKQVERRTSQLQEANERLERVNTGLQVLMEHRQDELKRIQENIVENANKLITPYIEKMDNKRMSAKNSAYLEVIASGLKELVSPFANTLSSKEVVLSPTEVRVADLIRQGKTSKEIASLMNVSANAITVHRYNIRRKLGLLNKKVNLRSYLQSLPT